ncbi:mitochondrial carrier [Thozetella sp. PMI_491]|nr:mitochondrial carrier [Thozetella sp. PMI_491]
MSLSKPVLPQNDNVAHALAGAGGGILSMVLTYPLVTLSTRAQVEAKLSNTSFLKTVQQIIARHGVSDLYSGLSSALLGISITNFVYYYWYEWTRAFFEAAAAKAGRASKKLTTIESMIAGAIAGSATVILTNPIWVVNTRVTTRQNAVEEDVEKGLADPRKAKRPTTTGTLLSMLRNEGVKSLFAGIVPALILVMNPILQYTFFEQMKNAAERRKMRVTPTIAFFLGALGKLFATTITYPYITVKSQMHVASDGKKETVAEAISRVIKEEGYEGLYKGIGPKVTQSVLTAAFLFAFKDALYGQSVRLRATLANKKLTT